MYGPPRFWMKPGANTQLVFLDDEPACIHEHNPRMNGSWKNWLTCIKDVHPDDPECCLAIGHDTRYYVGYFTVVDCTEWKDQKGHLHQFEIKLFPAKLKTLKLLQSKKEGRDNRLAGRVYKVGRTDKQSPGCGNDFEFDRDADLQKLFGVTEYKGKKLSELFKSDKPEEIEKLKKLFNLRMEGTAIMPRLVPFNYFGVLQPKSPKEMRDLLRGAKFEKGDFDDDDKSSSSSSSGDKGGGRKEDDDVPF
jgi:hypothetical protein